MYNNMCGQCKRLASRLKKLLAFYFYNNDTINNNFKTSFDGFQKIITKLLNFKKY